MMRKLITLFICAVVILSMIPLFKGYASQDSGNSQHAKIYMDNYTLAEASQYLPHGESLKNVTFESHESNRFKNPGNLPHYPLSKKVMSVVDKKIGIFIYDTASSIEQVKRYYFVEMNRNGWNLFHGKIQTKEASIFHNGKSVCLIHFERDSGITSITIVYQMG